MICREVTLLDGITGHLFITQMPGRTGDWEGDLKVLNDTHPDVVVCLTPLDEIQQESPGYANAITFDKFGWDQVMLPIPDFGLPDDRDAYLRLVLATADQLREGQRVVVHCGAGIGRSGTFAMCVLIALGLPIYAAEERVRAVGSGPETEGQHELVEWVAEMLGEVEE
jgi:protein-tyrosine phosphatase